MNESVESRVQAVLAQARAASDTRKNAAARAVPLLYRFSEMRHLQRWQQSQLVQEASARADREWPVVAACFVWLALVGCAVYFSPESSFEGGRSVLLTIVLGLPFLLVHRWRVHAHVREQLAADERSGSRA